MGNFSFSQLIQDVKDLFHVLPDGLFGPPGFVGIMPPEAGKIFFYMTESVTGIQQPCKKLHIHTKV